MLVKCKKCQAHVPATAADAPGTASDGTPVFAATCAGCGAKTAYRRPTPKPAEESSPLADLEETPVRPSQHNQQVMRLPAVVLEAAWWVKFTLITLWFMFCVASVFWLIPAVLVRR